jgi:phage terminase small subunit
MPQLKNSRHEAFARAIVKGQAAGVAYMTAGYKRDDANALRLTRNDKVAARIAELKEAAADATIMDRRETLQGLTMLARSNMQDYIGAHGQLLDISQLTREHAAAIHELITETYVEGHGEDAEPVKRVKLKLYDKRAALVDIGSRLDAAIKRALG